MLPLRKCQGWENGRGWTLGQVAQRFPTPTVNGNYNRKGASPTSGDGLATFVKKFPTPVASDSKGGAGRAKGRLGGDNLRTAVADLEGSGTLNPLWVEWLMGFPPGWTDCEALETPSSQKWHDESALRSLNGGGPLEG